MTRTYAHSTSYARGQQPVPLDAHVGDQAAYQRRLERWLTTAASGGRVGVRAVASELLEHITSTRNLKTAFNHVRRHGGDTAGPDGLTAGELTNNEAWAMCRALRAAVNSGTYRHGPVRKVRVPKPDKPGTRTLAIPNLIDRVVARAAFQVLQMLVAPNLGEETIAGRSQGREDALIALEQHQREGKHFCVVTDVVNAFGSVPHGRLMDVLALWFPDEALLNLLRALLPSDTKRGLHQGSPISSLMMEIYTDHFLDRPWRKKHERAPLLRYVDDIIVTCSSMEEAEQALNDLQVQLRPTGLKLHDNTNIIELQKTPTQWLGYRVHWNGAELEARCGKHSRPRLQRELEGCHESDVPPLRAAEVLHGYVGQHGPCYPYEDVAGMCEEVLETAFELGFDDVMDSRQLQGHWRGAHLRWRRRREAVYGVLQAEQEGDHPGGSACRTVSSATRDRRSVGAPTSGAPTLSLPEGEVATVHTDGCCLHPNRAGGWACLIEAPSLPEPVTGSGSLTRTTNNRAELLGVIRALQRFATKTRITLFSDSEYVVLGVTERLATWKLNGWRAGARGRRRQLQNRDLWKVLDRLLRQHEVDCRWVPAHSGIARNERVDALALVAARRVP